MKIKEFKAVVATMGLYVIVGRSYSKQGYYAYISNYPDNRPERISWEYPEGRGRTPKAAIKKLKEDMFYGNC